MKKALQTIALAALAGLFLASQVPTTALCEASGQTTSTVCKMACCKTGKIPLNCPILKRAAPPAVLLPEAPSVAKPVILLASLQRQLVPQDGVTAKSLDRTPKPDISPGFAKAHSGLSPPASSLLAA